MTRNASSPIAACIKWCTAALFVLTAAGCESKSQRLIAEGLYTRIKNGDCLAFNDLWAKADKKDAYASTYFGIALQEGWGSRCSTTQTLALKAYSQANGKLGEADFNAGLLLLSLKQYPQAEEAFKRAAGGDKGGGLSRAMFKLGELYEAGLAGFPNSQALAAQYYEKAADAGDLNGQARIAEMLLDGRGRTRNVERAMRQLENAATLGHLGARQRLFQIYDKGANGVPVGREQAAKWLGAAAMLDPALMRPFRTYLAQLDSGTQTAVNEELARFEQSVRPRWVPVNYDTPIKPS
jgi:TPR repeat protein